MAKKIAAILLEQDRRFAEEPTESNRRVAATYHIHHRVPRAVGEIFSATHFVRHLQSPEDRNYKKASSEATTHFSQTLGSNFNPLFPVGITPEHVIRKKIQTEFQNLISESPGFFIFGCFEEVVSILGRVVTDSLGHVSNLEDIFKHFIENLKPMFVEQHRIFLETLATLATTFAPLSDFGGTRHWFETPAPDGGRDQRDVGFQTIERLIGSFRYMKLLSDAHTPISYHLKWERLPQGWNYTFIEMLSAVDSYLIEHPVGGELRTEVVRLSATDRLRYRASLLLSFLVDPRVTNSALLPEVPEKHRFPGNPLAGAHYFNLSIEALMAVCIAYPYYPGYNPDEVPEYASSTDARVIEEKNNNSLVELLSADVVKYRKIGDDVILNEAEVKRRVRRIIEVVSSQPERIPTVSGMLALCLARLPDTTISKILNEHLGGDSTIKARMLSILTLTSVPPELKIPSLPAFKAQELVKLARKGGAALHEPAVFTFLGKIVKETLNVSRSDKPLRDDLLRGIADTTRFFWEMALSWTNNPVMGDAQDDYVASSMIDGHCLYFSNFVPTGSEMFTRTIFVDLGITGYERGRMLQRLSDLLTYRTMAIRDIDRAHMAISCLYELNRELNTVQSALATSNDAKTDATFLSNQLSNIQTIAARVGYMNSFFTYGIAGRYSSSEAYLNQILERCDDVREEPISGYPTLREFVERRLAHSIRNYERMHMHYGTVERRITELMDMIRTRLDAIQAEDVAKNLNKQTEAAEVLTKASDKLTQATTKISKNLDYQINLQKSADFIVVLGGTYYVYELLKITTESYWKDHHSIEWELVVLAFLICTSVRFLLLPLIHWVLPLAFAKIRNKAPTDSLPAAGDNET